MSGWRRRCVPAALPAALLAGGIALGGIPGFIAGFVAALLGIDRLLDRMHGFGGCGMDDAGQAASTGSCASAAGTRRGCAYLAEDVGPAATASAPRLGVRADRGRVDRRAPSTRTRREAFDAEFRPPPLRSRALEPDVPRRRTRGAALPPISVYRLGGRHYVRDGHHRVSVARALGRRHRRRGDGAVSASR